MIKWGDSDDDHQISSLYVMKACDVGGCITPLILNLNTKVVSSLTTGCGRFSPRE